MGGLLNLEGIEVFYYYENIFNKFILTLTGEGHTYLGVMVRRQCSQVCGILGSESQASFVQPASASTHKAISPALLCIAVS